MQKIAHPPYLGVILLLALGIVWGSGYAIARFAMTHGVSPLGYTFWQSLGPAILLTLISFLTRKPIKFSKPDLLFYLSCGLIGIAIPNANMYFAAPHLPSGILALIVNTVPIMIYPLALLSKQEKFHKIRLFGIILAITGVLCLVAPNAAIPEKTQAHWVLLSLITPFCFALFAVFLNPLRPPGSNPINLAAGMMALSTLMILPLVLLTHSFYWFSIPFSLTDGIVILEMILSSLGYVLFFWLLQLAGAVYYSLVDGVVAITGLIWGMIIFGERFSGWQACAVISILFAIALMTWQQKKR